jgi:hypothetical protein
MTKLYPKSTPPPSMVDPHAAKLGRKLKESHQKKCSKGRVIKFKKIFKGGACLINGKVSCPNPYVGVKGDKYKRAVMPEQSEALKLL